MAKLRKQRHLGVTAIQGKFKTSWQIDYVHPATGQRIRKILKNCTCESEAAEIRAVEIADAKRGVLNKAYGLKPKAAVVPFCGMVDEYLRWSHDNKDGRTDEQRSSALKKFFDGKLMSDITPWLVEKFKSEASKTRTKNTVNKYLSLGSQVFAKASEWKKYSGENPFLAAGRYKIRKDRKPGSLSVDDVAAIVAEIKHTVIRDAVEFGFHTGWRVREILCLKWSDVDLDAKRSWIMNPKNSRPVEIDLNDRAVELIRNQEQRSEFVFCKKNGTPFKTGLHEGFKLAAKRAGVALPLRKAWHMLRRSWASNFLQAGGDVETLRVLGNWRDYSMPMHYADAAGTDHRRAILNRLPSIQGRKKAEMAEVIKITN